MSLNLKPREIKSETLILKLEVELHRSTLTDQEAADRIEYLLNSSYCKPFSEFIVFLLRETRSSTWELKNLEISDASPNP